MRKSRFGIGAGFALALAGLMGSAHATAPMLQAQSQNEIKATAARYADKKERVVHTAGGLDVIGHGGVYGMSPRDYGMRFGNGASRKGKTNLNRCAHNAKLKRR